MDRYVSLLVYGCSISRYVSLQTQKCNYPGHHQFRKSATKFYLSLCPLANSADDRTTAIIKPASALEKIKISSCKDISYHIKIGETNFFLALSFSLNHSIVSFDPRPPGWAKLDDVLYRVRQGQYRCESSMVMSGFRHISKLKLALMYHKYSNGMAVAVLPLASQNLQAELSQNMVQLQDAGHFHQPDILYVICY
jgi:hypothetical protein